MQNKYTVTNNRTGESKTVEAHRYRDALEAAFDENASVIPRVASAPGEVVYGSLQAIVGERPRNYTVRKL